MSNEVAPPDKATSAEAFEIENNADRAYTFIIACGLLDKYNEFRQEFAGVSDWRAAAVMLLKSDRRKKAAK